MSRTLFENSKAALAFAAITIAGTVLMIGTGEGGGLLGRAVDQPSEEPAVIVKEVAEAAPEPIVPAEAFDADSGWGTVDQPFGDYAPSSKDELVDIDDVPAPVANDSVSPAAAPAAPPPRVTEPLATYRGTPTVLNDNAGTLVPRPGRGRASAAQRDEPSNAEDELTSPE